MSSSAFLQPLSLTAVLVACLTSVSIAQSSQAVSPGGCFSQSGSQLLHDTGAIVKGIQHAPRNAFRPNNLKWELPVAAATGLLIAYGDTPAIQHIQSNTLARNFNTVSNVGIAVELATAGGAFGIGCLSHRPSLWSTGFTALEAAGFASLINGGIKYGTNRQHPARNNAEGEFWEGGTSFASGHAANAFAIAAVFAHRYPERRWFKWTMYGLAAGTSFARYPAKRHFPSDILVGSAIGYVTGTYLVNHANDSQY